mgnify:CR=1 FL=1
MIHIRKSKNQIELNLRAVSMGNDLCIILTGGEAHLGAVTSGSGDIQLKTVSMGNHKEHYVTEKIGKILRGKFSESFVICCGIHFDNITKNEIQDIISLSGDMTEDLLKELGKWK